MDLDLRLLRSFVQMHEAGSLARAADRMGCTPAAMSMRLKMIEGQFGAPLFLRRPTGLVPNARGADLYARACDLLGRYDAMIAATRARPRRETLRLGMPDDYAMGWLPGLFRALEPMIDRLEIEVTCDLSAQLTAAVERADLDLALVTVPSPPAGARASGALSLVWLGAAAPQGPEVALAAYPPGCVFRRAMIDALEAAGQPWRIAVQGRGQPAIFAALRAGVAVTAVATGTAPPDLHAWPGGAGLLPPLPPVPLHLITAPSPRPNTRRAMAAILQLLPQLTPVPG